MIKKELKPTPNNNVSTYIPIIRTKDKHYKFNWNTSLGYFVHRVYQKTFNASKLDDFKSQCRQTFEDKLDIEDFWQVIEDIYFNKGQIYKISPELLTLKSSKEELDSNSKNLGNMYISLLSDFSLPSSPNKNLNFIEKELKCEFDKFCRDDHRPIKSNSSLTPYLPFLTERFKQDLEFLNSHPRYLFNNLDNFIKLYGFLYVSQMGLNVRSWTSEPKAKPCYLILDTEKASNERMKVKRYGFSQLRDHLEYLFPYLAMNESIQEKGNVEPIWRLADYLKASNDHLSQLKEYACAFVQKRELSEKANIDTNNSVEMLEHLLKLSSKQFERGARRYPYNQTAVKGLLKTLCNSFVQKRGRAGQVLILSQDFLVLLTNLAIGHKDKLRLHELIKAFESRGVFFDKQSQQCLVSFYERMGNVERMSDSGDAVYVRKTV